jgi:hypothetical protein
MSARLNSGAKPIYLSKNGQDRSEAVGRVAFSVRWGDGVMDLEQVWALRVREIEDRLRALDDEADYPSWRVRMPSAAHARIPPCLNFGGYRRVKETNGRAIKL